MRSNTNRQQVQIFALGIAVASAFTAGCVYGKKGLAKWQNHRLARRTEYDPCNVCATPLNRKTAHRVVERPDDEMEVEFSVAGGGTAFVADFCATHCPGGCNQPHSGGKQNGHTTSTT